MGRSRHGMGACTGTESVCRDGAAIWFAAEFRLRPGQGESWAHFRFPISILTIITSFTCCWALLTYMPDADDAEAHEARTDLPR